MNKADLEKWQTIEDEVLNSDLDEVAFCKSRKLNLDWFSYIVYCQQCQVQVFSPPDTLEFYMVYRILQMRASAIENMPIHHLRMDGDYDLNCIPPVLPQMEMYPDFQIPRPDYPIHV